MLSIASICLLIVLSCVESRKRCAPRLSAVQMNLHKVISPSMRTYCTTVCPQSSWNTPTATHLPPVVARHCCCVIYFVYRLVLVAVKDMWVQSFYQKSECAEGLVNETLNMSALFPLYRAQFKGMHCFWGSYLAVTLHPYSPFPPLVAQRGWKLSNEVRPTLKGSSLPGLWIFVTPGHPT